MALLGIVVQWQMLPAKVATPPPQETEKQNDGKANESRGGFV
jgi:hypothetical protein